jgi:hypothetical protein
MEIKGILRLALLPAALAILFNLLVMAGIYLAGRTAAEDGSPAMPAGGLALFLFSFPVNLGIYLYSGYRAAKSGATSIEGGIVSAAAFAAALTITTIAAVIISLFSFAGSEGSVMLFAGSITLIATLIGYFFNLISGLVINFIVGVLGGYIVTKKVP